MVIWSVFNMLLVGIKKLALKYSPQDFKFYKLEWLIQIQSIFSPLRRHKTNSEKNLQYDSNTIAIRYLNTVIVFGIIQASLISQLMKTVDFHWQKWKIYDDDDYYYVLKC